MKWHAVCLITIFLLTVNPIGSALPLATERGPFCAPFAITVLASHHGVNHLLW